MEYHKDSFRKNRIGPYEIWCFLGDTNQGICLAISLISHIIYKYLLSVKDENTIKKDWKKLISVFKTDLKSEKAVYVLQASHMVLLSY